MANKKDWYFRQKVLEGEMDDAFDELENADQLIATDAGHAQVADTSGIPIADIGVLPDDFDAIRGGIHAGYLISFTDGQPPSGGNPQPLTDVNVSAGFATDRLGQRVATDDAFIVDITSEGDTPVGEGGSTVGGAVVTPPVGQTRIVTLMVLFDRLLTDERVDGNAATVFYDQAESFIFRAKMGNASAGTPTPPQGDADAVILVDLEVDSNDTIVGWDFSRRGDWIRTSIGTSGDPSTTGSQQTGTLDNTGTDLIAPNSRQAILRIMRVLAGQMTDISAHIDNVNPSQTHTAANIDFKAPGTNWADGTSLIARAPGGGLTDGVQGAIREIMEDLTATGASADGAGRIGAELQIAGPGAYAGSALYSLPASPISNQLGVLLDAVEQQVVELTIGDGTSTFGNYNTSSYGGDMGATLQAALTSVPDFANVRVFLLGAGTKIATTGVSPANRNVEIHATSDSLVIDCQADVDFYFSSGTGAKTHFENITIQNSVFERTGVRVEGLFSARNCQFMTGFHGGLNSTTSRRFRFDNCYFRGQSEILRGILINALFTDCIFQVVGLNNADAVWKGVDNSLAFMTDVVFSRCRFSAQIPASAAFQFYFRFGDSDHTIAFVDSRFEDTTTGTAVCTLQQQISGPPEGISFIRCASFAANGVADMRAGNRLLISECEIAFGASGAANASVVLLSSEPTSDVTVRNCVITQSHHASGTKRVLYILTPDLHTDINLLDNHIIDVDRTVEFSKVERLTIRGNKCTRTTTTRHQHFIKGGVNWSLYDMVIDGNFYDGPNIDGTNQRAIDLVTGTFDAFTAMARLRVTNNSFINVGTAPGGGSTDNAIAIAITADVLNAQEVIVRGNQINNVQSNALAAGIRIEGIEKLTVTDNHVTDVGTDTDCAGPFVYGIQIDETDHTIVGNNLIDNIGGPSVSVATFLQYNSTTQMTGLTISGNRAANLNTSASVAGFNVSTSGVENVTITGNNLDAEGIVGNGILVTDSGSTVPFTRNVSITGNVVDGFDSGIEYSCSSAAAAEDAFGRVTIVGNTVNNFNTLGIRVVGAGSGNLQRTYALSSNTVFTTVTGTVTGIEADDVSDVTITGNTVRLTGGTGVQKGIDINGDGAHFAVSGNLVYVDSNNSGCRGIEVEGSVIFVMVTGSQVMLPFSAGRGIELNDGDSSGRNTHAAFTNQVSVASPGIPIYIATTPGATRAKGGVDDNHNTAPASLGTIDLNWKTQL
jgi:hypothetical protein